MTIQEIDPVAKFQIATNFQIPNTCIGCSNTCSDKNEPVMDLRKQIKFFGFLYLCRSCIEEMGRAFGLITAEQYETLSNTLSIRELEITRLNAENYQLRQVMNGYSELVNGDFGRASDRVILEDAVNSDDVENSSEDSETEETEDIIGDGLDEELSSGEGSDSGGITASSNIEGPSDVLSIEDDSESRDLFDS